MDLTLILNSWVSLAIAILFGVMGTISMKLSYGLKHKKPVLYVIFFYTISFIALTFAIKHLDLSVVYAVWSGVGTVLVALIGIFYFNESASIRKLFFLMLIVIGVIGIHFSEYIA